MSGLDENLQVTVTYQNQLLYCGPGYWSWDDDDENQIHVTLSVPKPEGL